MDKPIRVRALLEPGYAQAELRYDFHGRLRIDEFLLEIRANHERAIVEARGLGTKLLQLKSINALLGLHRKGVKFKIYGLQVQLEYGQES